MNDKEQTLYNELVAVVDKLPDIANELARRLGKPSFIDDGKDSRFLFDSPSWRIYQMLRIVRMVSGLRAALVLVSQGHTIESSVLLRTVHEFMEDIAFAQDALVNGYDSVEQQKEFTHFFGDFKDHPDQQAAGTFKVRRADRKKVQAAQGRYLDAENPHEVGATTRAISATLSGYVHGSYSTSMEMYVGGRDEFEMNGMLESPRITEALQALSFYIDMTIDAASLIALGLRDSKVAGDLRGLSAARSDGHGQDAL